MANEQQARHPLKRHAMQAVRDAVRRGHMVKPDGCSACGRETPRHLLAGHHARGHVDRLRVRWFCPTCHSTHDPAMNHR